MKKIIEKTIDILGAICIIVFFLSIILKIWSEDDIQWILDRFYKTSLTIFILIIVIYGFFIYEKDE
ncbi:MAG: hypothetical protein RSE15_04885 [Flavobacterium sp.]|uniref:hypothetical protein n=1 Tax=Flavobacterium sp. TaxID=239 RepID=UPI002B4758B3|nr:hypothetical protein [Flavobacterium sp.]WRH74164.1 MAG: hypothetical protein RSE15_04885 [Flavobacterium sp.]